MKNIKKVLPFFITTIVVVSAVIIGSYIYTNESTHDKSYITASWEYNYKDIEEISKKSDLIALVRVNNLVNSQEKHGIPFSTFEAQITDLIYGSIANDKIQIYMTGGSLKDNKIVEVIDDPLLENGQEFLIFAKLNTDGTYAILGGPEGRLAYKDGKLNSLQFVNDRVAESNKDMNIKIEKQDAKILITEIKDFMKN